MKRLPKTFIVEHKRRTRSATVAPSIWTGTTGRQLESLMTGIVVEADSFQEEREAPETSAESSYGGGRPRILEARVPVTAPSELELSVAARSPVRRRKPLESSVQDPVSAVIDKAVAELDDVCAAGLVAETMEMPADVASDNPARCMKPTFRERRREARKKLPLGERWKWNLKF